MTTTSTGLPGFFKCQHEHRRQRLTTAGIETGSGTGSRRRPVAGPQDGLDSFRRSWRQPWECKPPAPTQDVPASTDDGAKPATGPPTSGTQPTLSEVAYNALQEQIAASGIFPPPQPAFDLRAAILADLVHVGIENAYWTIEGKCLLKHKAVDDRLILVDAAQRPAQPYERDDEPLAPMAPTTWLKGQIDTQRVSRITHRLGKPLIVDDCLNIAPALPERAVGEGAPEPWFDLVSFVCNDVEVDIELVLDWMAFVVTAWDEKPGWHLLFKGEHGTGKNLALRPIVNHLMPDHWDKISATDIDGQFTDAPDQAPGAGRRAAIPYQGHDLDARHL